MTMDSRILRMLKENARVSFAEMADRLDMPEAAVREKVAEGSPTMRERVQYRQYDAHWVVTSINTRSG